MNPTVRTLLAILAGIITTFLSGLILFPVLKWIIIKNLHIFEKSSTVNNVAIFVAVFLWIAISSFLGGLTTAFAAPGRNIFYSLITGVISFVFVLCFAFYQQDSFSLLGVLPALEVIIFSLIGGIVQRKIALRKYEAE